MSLYIRLLDNLFELLLRSKVTLPVEKDSALDLMSGSLSSALDRSDKTVKQIKERYYLHTCKRWPHK